MQDADGLGNIWHGEVFSSVNIYPWTEIFHGTRIGGSLQGSLLRNTQAWQPGGHTLRVRAIDQTVIGNDVFRCYGFEKYYHVEVNNNANSNPNPAQRYYTAHDMATLIAFPGSAPVVPESVRFYGPYAAAQPYTGGTAGFRPPNGHRRPPHHRPLLFVG